jgi:DNA-binding NarL/FixJ family response regulator
MRNKIKVHIADDHKILIEGIIALIKTDDSLEVDGYSHTRQELLDWVSKNEIDVLILDISMPVLDGIEVLKILKRKKNTS